MNELLIPKDGKNPYADHPGFVATSCPLRYTVTHRGAWGGVIGGFGCEMTGGHCLPNEHCEKFRAEAKADDELRALINEAKGN